MSSRRDLAVLVGVTLLALASALPPLGPWLMRLMLTQMLVQIPLIFLAGVFWSARIACSAGTSWARWNAQGAPGLLFSALVLAFWMTPIALDDAASDSLWEAAKIASVLAAGISAGISWRLGSGVAHAFYVGNMVWMTITAGMLYEESTQRPGEADLCDGQTITRRTPLAASPGLSLILVLDGPGFSSGRDPQF